MLQAKMAKRLAWIAVMALTAASLFACKGGQKNPETTSTADTGQALPVQDALASGGTEISNINAKEIAIAPTANGADVSIRFVLGSKLQNIDEAETDRVPLYRAFLLEHPARLVIEFDSIDFWDYDRSLKVAEDDDLFYGVFKQIQSGGSSDERALFRIVFQLRQDVDVDVSDSGSELKIAFRTKATQSDDEGFYIMSTALQPFSAGELAPGTLFPSLSSDLNNQLLISDPYDNEAEAQAAMETLLADNPSGLNAQNTFLIALDGNALPGYANSADFKAVYTTSIIRRNGIEETLPVIMPDGIYLTSTDDNSMALFGKTIDNNEEGTAQELWIIDAAGKLKRLTEIEFGSISKAAFSPDGKKLALLEFTSDSSYLYIYDMETNTLDNLGEEHLGNTTSAFIWDSLGTAIFAISGNEQQQLLKYDFTMTDESMRVSAVEENEIGEGDLAFYNGEIYFTNITENDEEVVYRIKPEGGLRTPFAKGGNIRISQNGENMAILQTVAPPATDGEDADEDFSTTTLVLKNMVSGEEKAIVENTSIQTYDWAPDNKLYYTERISDDFSDKFAYRLMCYNASVGQLSEIAELSTSGFSTTPDPSMIYIPLISEDEPADAEGNLPSTAKGLHISATYRFKLDSPPPTPSPSQGPSETDAATPSATPTP